MKAYPYRFGTARAPVAALEADEGPYRLRHGADAAWPPRGRAYGGEVEPEWNRILGPLRVAARLFLPVTLLTVLLGAAYLYVDAFLDLTMAPALLQRALPTVSDLILPGAWFAVHLTNRRYGASYAFGQLVAGMALAIILALADPAGVDEWISAAPALSVRALLAFCGAFLLANFIAIVLFDGARGPRWWTAPLTASFGASLVFSAVYYPAAFAGGADIAWTDSALVHFALFFGESILLLFPYYLLRPAMRPLPGMNGY